jgi:hypothetical protein
MRHVRVAVTGFQQRLGGRVHMKEAAGLIEDNDGSRQVVEQAGVEAFAGHFDRFPVFYEYGIHAGATVHS